ncbi:MAG: hypothetical protein JW715_01360 [Sedimentisphaerales bacterium]|nr:hypothetical protein [Sedimentisphaerales bacterium]
MAQIAVDVVLLPSNEMMNTAIEANRKLLKQYPDKIILDKKNCLPHISLAMGCIEEKFIADIELLLRNIIEKHSFEPLRIISVQTNVNTSGEKVSVLQIEKTESILLLHEQVMEELSVYFTYNVSSDMILGDEAVGNSTLLWIKNYPKQSSYENFSPHITLGYGEIELESFPSGFLVSKLALCHLGNHCTCKKILAAAQISN